MPKYRLNNRYLHRVILIITLLSLASSCSGYGSPVTPVPVATAEKAIATAQEPTDAAQEPTQAPLPQPTAFVNSLPGGDGIVQAWAILAQKDNYDDVGMTNLPVDYIGINHMRQLLEKSGWEKDNIHDLREFDQETLQQGLGWLAEKADQDDIALLYVAAHGMYLKKVLDWGNFFPPQWRPIPSQQRVLIIDSCQAANYTGAVSSDPAPYLAIAAVAQDEYGWSGLEEEGLPIIGGVFTHYFVAAFDDPQADADSNGLVSVQEAAGLAQEQQRTYMHEVVFAVPEFVEMYREFGDSDKDADFPHVIVHDTIGQPLYLALEAYAETSAELSAGVSTSAATASATLTAPPTEALSTPLPVKIEELSFSTEDGVELAGKLFWGGGDIAVVLAHMGISDQQSWKPFAAQATQGNFTALTFDFRCFGMSSCDNAGASDYLYAKDVQAAIAFLRQSGFERIVCMGASMGGTACMNAAMDQELAGLVVIASPAPVNVFKQYPRDLINPGMPKLFIVTDKDRYPQVTTAVPFLYQISPEPKALKVFSGTVHGTELFGTSYRGEFRDLLLDFVKSTSSPQPPPR